MAYDPSFISGQQIPLPIPNQRLSQSIFSGDYIHICATPYFSTKTVGLHSFLHIILMELQFLPSSSRPVISRTIQKFSQHLCKQITTVDIERARRMGSAPIHGIADTWQDERVCPGGVNLKQVLLNAKATYGRISHLNMKTCMTMLGVTLKLSLIHI